MTFSSGARSAARRRDVDPDGLDAGSAGSFSLSEATDLDDERDDAVPLGVLERDRYDEQGHEIERLGLDEPPAGHTSARRGDAFPLVESRPLRFVDLAADRAHAVDAQIVSLIGDLDAGVLTEAALRSKALELMLSTDVLHSATSRARDTRRENGSNRVAWTTSWEDAHSYATNRMFKEVMGLPHHHNDDPSAPSKTTTMWEIDRTRRGGSFCGWARTRAEQHARNFFIQEQRREIRQNLLPESASGSDEDVARARTSVLERGRGVGNTVRFDASATTNAAREALHLLGNLPLESRVQVSAMRLLLAEDLVVRHVPPRKGLTVARATLRVEGPDPVKAQRRLEGELVHRMEGSQQPTAFSAYSDDELTELALMPCTTLALVERASVMPRMSLGARVPRAVRGLVEPRMVALGFSPDVAALTAREVARTYVAASKDTDVRYRAVDEVNAADLLTDAAFVKARREFVECARALIDLEGSPWAHLAAEGPTVALRLFEVDVTAAVLEMFDSAR